MIASPGDVQVERGIVRDVIQEWNSINSSQRKIVLQAIGWDTHASPQMGDRPQAIINKQILKDADLLIAIFWTRLGTPTGEASSGTVEEINEHIDAGKPAMIYFSSAPVRPDSIDEKQYSALKDFKNECLKRGLIESFESTTELRIKVARQLAATLNSHEYFQTEGDAESSVDFEEFIRTQPEIPTLSKEAQELLLETAQDPHGRVAHLRFIGGEAIQTNGKEFIERGNPRSRALWQGALEELQRNDLIASLGYKGEMFEITQRGYDVAEILKK